MRVQRLFPRTPLVCRRQASGGSETLGPFETQTLSRHSKGPLRGLFSMGNSDSARRVTGHKTSDRFTVTSGARLAPSHAPTHTITLVYIFMAQDTRSRPCVCSLTQMHTDMRTLTHIHKRRHRHTHTPFSPAGTLTHTSTRVHTHIDSHGPTSTRAPVHAHTGCTQAPILTSTHVPSYTRTHTHTHVHTHTHTHSHRHTHVHTRMYT